MGEDGTSPLGEDWVQLVFSADEFSELNDKADEIITSDNSMIELKLVIDAEGAREFIDKYDKSCDGDMMAVFGMMTFIGAICEHLEAGLLDAENDD